MREKLLHPDPLEGSAYRSLSVLGEGSMGVVVEAEHLALGKTVCVKLVRGEMTDDPAIVERFRIEARALAALGGGNHPNLVHVSDFGVTREGSWFLAMERLRGQTLKDHLQAHGAMPWREAAQLIQQLLTGLEIAHAAGVVHRDIKPANLFLVEPMSKTLPPMLKILDFGIAKILDRGGASLVGGTSFETAPGLSIGTPRYLSPEQAFARPVDHRADLYAAGLVFYEMLAARGPFQHRRTVEDIYRAQALEIPTAPSKWVTQGIAPELDAFVLKLLQKDPNDRFRSAEETREALARLLDVPPRIATVAAPNPLEVIQTELLEVAPRRPVQPPVERETVRLDVASRAHLPSAAELTEGDRHLAVHTEKLSNHEKDFVAPVNTSSDAQPVTIILGRPLQHWIAFLVALVASLFLFSLAAWLLLRRAP